MFDTVCMLLDDLAIGQHHSEVKLMVTQELNGSPRAVNVEQAAKLIGIGRSLAWDMVRRGDLRSVKAGHRTLIPLTVIDEFLAGATAASEADTND